ncbi:surface antigen, putative, partial [Bodo saltans]
MGWIDAGAGGNRAHRHSDDVMRWGACVEPCDHCACA